MHGRRLSSRRRDRSPGPRAHAATHATGSLYTHRAGHLGVRERPDRAQASPLPDEFGPPQSDRCHLSPQTAYQLLSAASAHDLTIVEDDIFANFEPTSSPRLAVLDGLNRVIRFVSFSKTLSASVRCGHIAGRADWIEGHVDLQVATSFGGPSPVATELIASVLASGSYRKHMDEIRQRLTRARKEAVDRLAPLGIAPWIIPPIGKWLLSSAMLGKSGIDTF